MLRKLVIIGSITALFVLTASPAFGLTLNDPDGQGATTVNDIGEEGESNPAHGPHCGNTETGTICDGGVSQEVPGHHAPGLITSREDTGDGVATLPFNVGAWNAVFGPGGMSNPNTPICGIRTVELPGLDDGTLGTNTCVTNV